MRLTAVAVALISMVVHNKADARDRYALVIANKAYNHTASVEFADRDADAMETALINVWAVKRRNIRRENNVTSSDLKFLFGTENSNGTLASMAHGTDSELIVYFAGHGSKENGKPYLLGIDTRPTQLSVTGYSLDLLLSRLDEFQNRFLPDGRVTVILEACFSGRSHTGELVKGTSAPAFGPPIVISQRMRMKKSRPGKLVVMTASQGDEYAVWDTEYRQSLFTDALVSGLHGEADRGDFGGNDDGKITLGELDKFVSRRVGRRLNSIRPGVTQSPEFVGGRADDTLAVISSISGSWREQYRRSYSEELKANLLLSDPSASSIQGYLSTCLYCPKRGELLTALDKLDRKNVACEIERPAVERLLSAGTAKQITSYKVTCRCCTRMPELNRRLTSLRGTKQPEERKITLAKPDSQPENKPANQRPLDVVYWEAVRKTDDKTTLRDFIRRFPKSIFTNTARRRLNRLEAQRTEDSPSGSESQSSKKDQLAALDIGRSNEFKLFSDGGTAFIRDRSEEQRLLEALIRGRKAHVRATAKNGARIEDTYSLYGVSAAWDQMSRNCPALVKRKGNSANSDKIVQRHKKWSIHTTTKICFATSAALGVKPKRRRSEKLYMYITNWPGNNVEGEISVIIGKELKLHSDVTIRVE